MRSAVNIEQLVEALGGSPRDIYRRGDGWAWYELESGDLRVRIDAWEPTSVPWVDVFHVKDGSLATFRMVDLKEAVDLINYYRGGRK
mgnify:CR=1 FL=1